MDNRTAGFRLCGEGHQAVRVECRVGGSDLNPYLAMAAHARRRDRGDRGQADAASHSMAMPMRAPRREFPTPRAATETLRCSKCCARPWAMMVIDHYTRAAEWEQESSTAVVTDWEIARGFERA